MSASRDAEWAAARREYQVQSVDSTTIVAVTQNQTCQKILAAFNAAAPISPAPTRIYAVKVGTGYVATYPMFNEHYWPMVVLDSKFKLLTKTAIEHESPRCRRARRLTSGRRKREGG